MDVDRLTAAAQSLNVDRVAVEVFAALDAAAISSILLKGRSFAELLYAEGGRRYTDVDILIRPADLPRAIALLQKRSFELLQEGFRPSERSARETVLWRQGRAGLEVVELHSDLRLTPRSDRTWRVLSARTVLLNVAGASVRVLDIPARLMHVALHAAQHGIAGPHPLGDRTGEDLRRALSRFGTSHWRLASAVAHDLGLADAFAFGLRLDPHGQRVADDLGLRQATSDRYFFNAGVTAPVGTHRVHSLWLAPTWRARWTIARDALAPSQARTCHLAGIPRGSRGLVLAGAYVRYWMHLAAAAIPAAWRATKTLTPRNP